LTLGIALKRTSVREITADDVPPLASYWVDSDPVFMKSMGVDVEKIPARNALVEMISQQLTQSYREKKAYAIVWLMNNEAIGHCNVNKITFGEEATMHLHIWKQDARQKGIGTSLVKQTLPYFYNNLHLKKLWCEPYALNPAPNKTLEKVGFEFVKEYVTVPGVLNFQQPVKQWLMTRDKFLTIAE